MKWKPLRNYLFPLVMDEINLVKEHYIELVQHIQFFNKESNKREYLALRKSIEKRTKELSNFIEDNFGKPNILHFQKCKIILMQLLTISPQNNTERQASNYKNVEVDFNNMKTNAGDDEDELEKNCPCYNKISEDNLVLLEQIEKLKKKENVTNIVPKTPINNKKNIKKVCSMINIKKTPSKTSSTSKTKDKKIITVKQTNKNSSTSTNKRNSKIPSKKLSETKIPKEKETSNDIIAKVSKLNLNSINIMNNNLSNNNQGSSTKIQTKLESENKLQQTSRTQKSKTEKDKSKTSNRSKTKLNFYQKFLNKKYLRMLFPKSLISIYQKSLEFNDELTDEMIYSFYELTEDYESSSDSFNEFDISSSNSSNQSFNMDVKEITFQFTLSENEYEFLLKTKANRAFSISISKEKDISYEEDDFYNFV